MNDEINTISTFFNKFNFKYLIDGSENQDLLDDYYDFIQKFNGQNLDLQKAYWQAQINQNADSIALIEKQQKALEKRKYLYAINFAMNNKDSEIAPYIALSEIYNAKVTFLDTIYKALPTNIANSKYGLQLDEFIQERKKEDAIK